MFVSYNVVTWFLNNVFKDGHLYIALKTATHTRKILTMQIDFHGNIELH